MTVGSGITYETAWQKKDEKIMKDACAIWVEMGVIKDPAQGMQRAQVLCVVAYDGDKMVGISTIEVKVHEQVHAKACHFMCVVRPDYRRRHIATELAERCNVVTEEWSKENPSFQVLAFSIRVQSPNLVMKALKPVWNNKLIFIGYSQEGLPYYLRWFKHARFGEKEDPDFAFYPTRPGALGRI